MNTNWPNPNKSGSVAGSLPKSAEIVPHIIKKISNLQKNLSGFRTESERLQGTPKRNLRGFVKRP